MRTKQALLNEPSSNPGKTMTTIPYEDMRFEKDLCRRRLDGHRMVQVFPELFPEKALESAEGISVETTTLLFTDLCDSTLLYRNAGEFSAFGAIMRHFKILKTEIENEGGTVVKTIGDSVMASFESPVRALRAVLTAQEILANPPDGEQPLVMKAAIHTGPCIRVDFDDHFDYFGTTVNLAAKLRELSNGNDVITSTAVCRSPGVAELLRFDRDDRSEILAEPCTTQVRGLDLPQAIVWRVSKSAEIGEL